MQKSLSASLLKYNNYKNYNHAATIAASFSKNAFRYDQFARIQKFASNHLSEQIIKNVNALTPAHVLEIGCGSGFLSQFLANYFPDSAIDFLDPATAMLSLCKNNINNHLCLDTSAKNHNFIEASIEDYLSNKAVSQKKYSLIVSSFTLHWIADLSSVINNLIQRLEPGGQFFFSYPSNKSFPEWKSICQRLALPFTGNLLPSAEALNFFIKSDQTTITWHEYSYQLAFPNALAFFREMKNVGANSTMLTKNDENYSTTQQLSIKEFRRLLTTWDEMFKETAAIKIDNEITDTVHKTVGCTYWLVEGIITRHS